MTAREILESYGEMLQKSALMARETAACRRHAVRDKANAAHWEGKTTRLIKERRSLDTRINRRLKQLDALLARLPDQAAAQVLALRYISLMSYAQISEALHFSERHIYRLHLKGVHALDTLLM